MHRQRSGRGILYLRRGGRSGMRVLDKMWATGLAAILVAEMTRAEAK